MVPVRKPGRPLSACPHPRDRPCNCGSVTAAIPKKQACGCGGNTSSAPSAEPTLQDSGPSPAEPTSPTKATFKVQKPFIKSHSNRKQSLDISQIERMDMNNVNIVSFEQRPPNGLPMVYPNGYPVSGTPQDFGFVPQFQNFQPQDYKIPMQPQPHITPDVSARMMSLGGGTPLAVVEHAYASPIDFKNGAANDSNGTITSTAPILAKVVVPETNGQSNGKSCCAPKPPSHSHSSSSASSISEPQEPTAGGCCSSKAPPPAVKDEPLSADGIPMNLTPHVEHPMLLGNGLPFTTALYPQYMPAGVFTYPPTYGSFSNPLEPYAWRQSARANSYIMPGTHGPMTSVPNFLPTATPETEDTVHTCHCGDGCQCVGCAAHPYNDATQSYVRSAYTSMAAEPQPGEIYSNGSSSTPVGGVEPNGNHGTETVTANTPTSSTSGNGEEQNLSASDFFFVNYPLSECGGDTESCPCGDDCKCLGCTIHNWPARPVET